MGLLLALLEGDGVVGSASLSRLHGSATGTGEALPVVTGEVAAQHTHGSAQASGEFVPYPVSGNGTAFHDHGSATGTGKVNEQLPSGGVVLMGALFKGNARSSTGQARLRRSSGNASAAGEVVVPARGSGIMRNRAGSAMALGAVQPWARATATPSKRPGGVLAEGEFQDTEALELLLIFHSVA